MHEKTFFGLMATRIVKLMNKFNYSKLHITLDELTKDKDFEYLFKMINKCAWLFVCNALLPSAGRKLQV